MAAGRLIADAVRYLNYATMPVDGAAGVSYAGDADHVLGSIAAALGGLQQLFGHVEECLRADLATGRARLDAGRHYADGPAKAVEAACLDLEVVRADCGALQTTRWRGRGGSPPACTWRAAPMSSPVYGVRVAQQVNDLELGSRWYSCGYGPERIAIVRAVRVGGVPKGRRRYV